MITSFLDIGRWIETPEKRMKLMRVVFLLATGMMVFGFILIIISLIIPDFLP